MICNSTSYSDPGINLTTNCAVFDFCTYSVAGGILVVFGIMGNMLSFIVMMKDRNKAATSFFLQALAVADSLVLVTAVPLYCLSNVYPATGLLKDYYAHTYPSITSYLWAIYQMPYTCMVILTVMVSLNRYFAVCKPFETTKVCELENARKIVIAVTVFAIVYNIPRFFEYERKEMCTGYNQSTVVFGVSSVGNNIYYRVIYTNILYFLVIHGGPLLTLSVLNIKLIRALKKRQQRRAEMGKADYQHDVTLVLVVVIFVFMFCQTPTFLDHIFWTALGDSPERAHCGSWHYFYTAIGDLFVILNSSVNFIIYTLTSRKFREILNELICNARGANSSGAYVTNGHVSRMDQTVITRRTGVEAETALLTCNKADKV